ncbi:MAG: zinc ribbon domain-containing protein, partial [Acidobacteria bacterium]|nr:zinc ribbon domain-containing protein [Acidobacteriota bacterium]
MNCRNCGTEIAEKALICYRCGAATTERRVEPAQPSRRAVSLSAWPVIIALVLIVIALITAPPGELRPLPWIAALLAVALAIVQLVRR